MKKKTPLEKYKVDYIPLKYETPKFISKKEYDWGKPKKVFTNVYKFVIVKLPLKLIERTTMAHSENKHDKKRKQATHTIQKFAWLMETVFRSYVGWVLLAEFDSTAMTAVGLYALSSAGMIVVYHFLNTK